MQPKSIFFILISFFISSNIYSQTNTNCPCCETEFRQFDFWLGDWEVSQKGTPAGTNLIMVSQDSCVLVENWKSATSDYEGSSYNYYDKQTKMWYQTWVDNKGGNLRLKGVFDSGKMILMDEPTLNQKNQLQINKISWTPNVDGTVTQHWELSTDLGNSWTTLFNGVYKKKSN